jgi:CheY-like chemotaxis protein
VSASIIRQHGGEITVASEPGVGTRFSVTLPLGVEAPARTTEPLAAESRGASGRNWSDARVLVVEDEPPVRRLIQSVLTSQFGCDVDIAANGLEAFERLASQQYALVVSDLRMPAMNGTELFLWLREAQPETARRFIFVTGYPAENHLEHDVPDWRIPVLAKPFTMAQLCEACAPFLERTPAGEPLLASGQLA